MNNIQDISSNNSYFNLLINNNYRENLVNLDFEIVNLSNDIITFASDISLLNTPEQILGERLYNNIMNSFNNVNNLNNVNNFNNIAYDTSFIEFTIPYIRFPELNIPNMNIPLDSSYNRGSGVQNYLRSLLENIDYDIDYDERLNNFINRTFDSDKKKYKRVISDDSLSNLKIIKFQKKDAELNDYNMECPITQCKFNENEEVILLPCSHLFEPEGIIKWLSEESNTCPMCRYEFDHKEILNDEYIDEEENESRETNNRNNTQTPIIMANSEGTILEENNSNILTEERDEERQEERDEEIEPLINNRTSQYSSNIFINNINQYTNIFNTLRNDLIRIRENYENEELQNEIQLQQFILDNIARDNIARDNIARDNSNNIYNNSV